MSRWGDRGDRGDGEMGRWGDGEMGENSDITNYPIPSPQSRIPLVKIVKVGRRFAIFKAFLV